MWVDGQHYELDCLIFASGFEVGTEQARRAGYETYGRDGLTLTERWADGMQSLHGIHVHGFPNLFIIGLTQAANLISNITSNLVDAGTTIAAVVRHALDEGAEQVEVTAEAEQAWIAQLETGGMAFLGNPECTPGYYNNEGQPMGRRERLNTAGYPGGPIGFWDHIERWRSSGEFEGLELRVPDRPTTPDA